MTLRPLSAVIPDFFPPPLKGERTMPLLLAAVEVARLKEMTSSLRASEGIRGHVVASPRMINRALTISFRTNPDAFRCTFTSSMPMSPAL